MTDFSQVPGPSVPDDEPGPGGSLGEPDAALPDGLPEEPEVLLDGDGDAEADAEPEPEPGVGADAGALVLAATPIGNTQDASPRLRRLLASADVVAAEDTRRLHALVARLGVSVRGRVVSYHEHNEAARADELLDVVDAGGTVVVVTDAGMPSVSDPGYRVVGRAIERGVRVTAAPGPSAVLTALALSGLPTDRFTFEGFLPRKAGDRTRTLGALAAEPRTMVFFEAPHRIAETLDAMAGAFGPDRPAAVCRELTKTYEEVLRGPLTTLAAQAHERALRGEICVVVAGAPPAAAASPEELVGAVLERVGAGERLKEAVAAVAEAAGVPKRELYAAALAAR